MLEANIGEPEDPSSVLHKWLKVYSCASSMPFIIPNETPGFSLFPGYWIKYTVALI